MTSEHRESLRLPYRPDELFDLVSDVRAYPRFIPLISALRVIRDDVDEGVGELDAEARVQFRFVRESFTTRVLLDRPGRTIKVSYLSGPFHELANEWSFAELEDGSTQVSFWIRYRFRNPVLNALMDASRSRAIRYLIERFREEAARRYTPVGSDAGRVGEKA
ncbi:type II toxin-antitoxin system RatA family toxin [Glycocaulis sp.]|uniref:type II toxin-antitoxin system RatA family toxin n=1 Tax=Glycocaulis sp. TaxID=1969725 RepID=UPI003D20F892